MRPVPTARIVPLNDAAVRRGGEFILYWMIAQRRTRSHFALQRAAEWARDLRRPLLVFEPLRCGYRWASHRLHAFLLGGMADNAAACAAACAAAGVTYFPYVEPEPDAGKGLLAALARAACVVVTDDFPTPMLRHMAAAGARQVGVRCEAVDACGLFPLRATDRDWPTAHAFRRVLQRELPHHLIDLPEPDPLDAVAGFGRARIPPDVAARWPAAPPDLLAARPEALARLPIDAAVAPVAGEPGGPAAAAAALRRFVAARLDRYADDRNQPQEEVASGLSAYLHFGHVSVFEVLDAVAAREEWTPARLAARPGGGARPLGSREGWWRMSRPAEAFLDELVTWREVGFNGAHVRPDYASWEALPAWARATLDAHADDEREHVYALDDFEAARTHDPLWNAAQTQLRREGRIHNYLRMLWGKKVLEWTATPREALDVMIHLNDRWALDGRDPNSYTGIGWVLGRHDRPWGPERPVFGKVRYMSSDNTARKLRVRDYLARYEG